MDEHRRAAHSRDEHRRLMRLSRHIAPFLAIVKDDAGGRVSATKNGRSNGDGEVSPLPGS